MPWPEGHKARTRERIVRAAAEAFRARGVSGVRIEEIMAGAGLTHGAFYAHFASKDELLGSALEHASGETVERLSAAAGDGAGERRFGAAIDAYLSAVHAAHPERGCPVAALGPELSRSDEGPRRELARGIRERLRWMRQLLPGGRAREREELVAGSLACMIGGVILARAVGGKEGEALLASCRRFLHGALESASASATPSPTAASSAPSAADLQRLRR
jgi:TetR/AcrR family transcriptional repressor of nem operon